MRERGTTTGPLERLLFWVEVVTRPVAEGHRANDEMVEIEARDLYNLLHARRDFEATADA